jgi:myosin heavy subunit
LLLPLLLLLLQLQDCIALIETKPNGIIPTLDEQCLIGKATDDRYARELYKKCEGNTRFEVSNKMRVDHQFQIKHYAGAVTYSTVGIIEKNRDTLAQEVMNHLSVKITV